jgi:hypothetical protein
MCCRCVWDFRRPRRRCAGQEMAAGKLLFHPMDALRKFSYAPFKFLKVCVIRHGNTLQQWRSPQRIFAES